MHGVSDRVVGVTRRQIFFGLYDMTIHTMPAVDSGAVWARMRPEVCMVPETPGNNPAASFGHLVGGCVASVFYFSRII
jgi:thimet oligopeptidase